MSKFMVWRIIKMSINLINTMIKAIRIHTISLPRSLRGTVQLMIDKHSFVQRPPFNKDIIFNILHKSFSNDRVNKNQRTAFFRIFLKWAFAANSPKISYSYITDSRSI